MPWTGPYETEDEALEACGGSGGNPWWCVQVGDSVTVCQQAAEEPVNAVAGPWATAGQCADACNTEFSNELSTDPDDPSCGDEDEGDCECGYVDWVWSEATQSWQISDANFHCTPLCSPHYPSACGMAVYGTVDGQIWTTCCVGAPMMMMSVDPKVVEPKEQPPLRLEK